MPEINPEAGDDQPRAESRGEKEQRWAGNLAQAAKVIGWDVTPQECQAVAEAGVSVDPETLSYVIGKGTALLARWRARASR